MESIKRKNIRLNEYDYSQNGAYLITICVKHRHEMLCENVGARIARPQEPPQLSEYGLAIDNAITNIPKHYSNVMVDKYVIMPNHIHMIIFLNGNDGRAMRAPTISTIINQMKVMLQNKSDFHCGKNYFTITLSVTDMNIEKFASILTQTL